MLSNDYEFVLAMRPPGTAHFRRDNMMLKDDLGRVKAHLQEVPIEKLGDLLARLRGRNVTASEYGFRWLASEVRYFRSELHNIRRTITDVYDRIEQLQSGVNSINQRLEDGFLADVEVVLELLDEAQQLTFDEARSMFAGSPGFSSRATLKALIKHIERAMSALGKNDPQRVSLLLQLATVACLEARVRLLCGAADLAVQDFGAFRARIDSEAVSMLKAWEGDVDLLEVVTTDELDDLLVDMQIIDGETPMSRLKRAYAALPRVTDPQNGVIHSELDTADEEGGVAEVDLNKAALWYYATGSYSAKLEFVRRGQAIGPVIAATSSGRQQRRMIKRDGFLLSLPGDHSYRQFLSVRGTTLPIPGLAEHIRRLSGLVREVRAMADGVTFSAEQPEAVHEIVRMSSGMTDIEGIELVFRPLSAQSIAALPKPLPSERREDADLVLRLENGEVG